MERAAPLVELDPSHGNDPGGAETHISVLLFAGARAYKLCKPVDVGFLDYSTRERRATALWRELEVNRRFAPDVYLDVVDLAGSDGTVHDHALVMRRMPAERRLAGLLGRPETAALVREVAKAVAAIHAAAPRHPDADAAASRDAVARNWADNEAAIAPFVDSVLARGTFEAVGRDWRRYLAGRGPLFAARVAAGHAVDGHGDLLAEDVFCLDDGPRILDCLAFDDQLRYGDALLDAAFLAMDLERLDGPATADAFLDRYREFSGEHHPGSLADHYIAYRAQVRAKVACLRAEQGDDEAAADAADHLARCARHLASCRVRLVLVGGTPGTGKSTLANELGERRGWAVVRSDEVRKELSGMAASEDATAPVGEGIYRAEVTASTYGELLRRARALVELGESVVLDASWTDGGQRALARQLGEEAAADLVELQVDAPPEVVARRIAARRAAGGDASDATVEVARHLREGRGPWPEATVVDTNRPLADSVEQAMTAIG
ncbi:MAG: AAA family ATPase [Acidimicrobiia bacterium]|nr:AAA family ATPase [Acidimicrobiia bacterium]